MEQKLGKRFSQFSELAAAFVTSEWLLLKCVMDYAREMPLYLDENTPNRIEIPTPLGKASVETTQHDLFLVSIDDTSSFIFCREESGWEYNNHDPFFQESLEAIKQYLNSHPYEELACVCQEEFSRMWSFLCDISDHVGEVGAICDRVKKFSAQMAAIETATITSE